MAAVSVDGPSVGFEDCADKWNGTPNPKDQILRLSMSRQWRDMCCCVAVGVGARNFESPATPVRSILLNFQNERLSRRVSDRPSDSSCLRIRNILKK